MSELPQRHNIFFTLTVAFGLMFIVTIFAVCAALFGDPRAPISVWLNQYGGIVLGVEVGCLLTSGFVALVVDRRQTLRDLQNLSSPEADGEETQKG